MKYTDDYSALSSMADSIMLPIMLIGVMCQATSGQILVTEAIANDTNNQSCRYYGSKAKLGYIGWPLELRCRDALEDFEDVPSQNLSCTIKTSNGTEIFFRSGMSRREIKYGSLKYQHPRIEVLPTNASYTMKIESPETKLCAFKDVIVYGEEANKNKHDCRSLPSSFNIRSGTEAGTKYKPLFCTVPGSNPVKLAGHRNDYSYEWWYNCSRQLPPNVTPSLSHKEKLLIRNVSFANGGEYVCVVRHKNHTRFLSRYVVCVTNPTLPQHSMNCPEKVSGKKGSSLNITCYIDEPLGFNPPVITWYRKADPGPTRLCRGVKSYHTHIDEVEGNDHIHCENALLQRPKTYKQKCFQYTPPPSLLGPDPKYRATLIIKNLEESDVGEYTVHHALYRKMSERTIKVSLDRKDEFQKNSIYIGIGASVAILSVILCILCYYRRVDILWLYKKYLGAFEKEKKLYDVVLVYHYSKDDMKDTSKALTEKLVDRLHSFLADIGMTVYDEQKQENDFMLQVQNIANTQSDCHRIVVVMNEEIVADEWKLHQVYTAIKNAIKNGTSVIFIPLPGMKKKFGDNATQAEVTLRHAMDLGTTIEWSGHIPFSNEFKRKLEYALPKKVTKRAAYRQATPDRPLMQTAV